MIYTYEIRVRGVDHEQSGTPCQDACRIIKHNKDLVIAAVADGVSSEKRSDFGARIAVDISTCYCTTRIAQLKNPASIVDVIKKAFEKAQSEIEKEAEVQGHSVAQYHTTLSLAVLHRDTLYYGHSGDSGIIALTTDGNFESVTEKQQDENGGVHTLYFEKKRIFGQFNKEVCSVLLATDGMLDLFTPKILENESVKINTYAAGFFVGDWKARIDESGEMSLISQIENYVINGAREVSIDDLTVIGLINTSVGCTAQPDDYYKEPDWAELDRKYMNENLTDETENSTENLPSSPDDRSDVVSVDRVAVISRTEQIETDAEQDTLGKTEEKPSKQKGLLKKIFGR